MPKIQARNHKDGAGDGGHIDEGAAIFSLKINAMNLKDGITIPKAVLISC
jgi:hypothetical protein